MYALIMTLCLLDGNCYGNGVEVFTDLESCKAEAAHQVVQGIPQELLSCEIMDNEIVENEQ